MREINELTKRLLAEGYTEENPPPEYIPYNKYYGGWQYSHRQLEKMVVKTPCGLHKKARFSSDMGYMGIDWVLENDNATIYCPYTKLGCPLNNEIFRDTLFSGTQVQCVVQITDEEYDYEKSVEKVETIHRQRDEEKIKAFAKTQSGFCRQHLCYNQATDTYYLNHDPTICATMKCTYCTLKKQPMDKAKGNVFYDLKITTLQKGEGLFPDELKSQITKGIRFFDKNISLDVCKWIVEKQDLIDKKVRDKYFTQLFFAKYHGRVFEYEILNIRAEKRVSRDLEQDLQDIADGIEVVHQSDLVAEEKSRKHENRVLAVQKKIKKLQKLVEQNGYTSLPWVEQNRIQKLLNKDLITDKDLAQWEKTYENNRVQKQLSLFGG